MSDERKSLNEFSESHELRQTLNRTRRALARAEAKTEQLVDAVYTAARDAGIAVGSATIPPKPAKDKRKDPGEVALIHTTDWQVGKKTSSYNIDVARTRLTVDFCDRVERLTEVQRHDHPVRKGAYLYGGDMEEGLTIFPGQAWSVDSTMFDQLFEAANIMEAQLLHGLTLFDEIDVWYEKGNHGRQGRRGELPDTDNWDLIMYRIVMERFRHEPRIKWHPLTSPHIWNHVIIGNYEALLVHGDEIKSFGGNTPAFGIIRKCTKWRAGVAPKFRDVYMGHFHTRMVLPLPDGGRIFVTGSPESDNSYATEFMAETGDPSQLINFIDPQTGRVTAEYVIWLV